MAHRIRYFKVDIREPYMGNTLPLKFEVQIPHALAENQEVELVVINPEGRRHHAQPISPETFNE